MGKKEKGMDVFILLDRTGSMARLWTEAVSSVNTYVRELAKDGADDLVTLAVFDLYDGGMQYDVLRDSVGIAEWQEFGAEEVLPRGSTPLLDALMRTITIAEEKGNKKTAIVVMTDGYENASREVDLESAKAALDRVQAKNWQVNFLGADFDGIDQASGLGIAHAHAMNFPKGSGNVAMHSTAERHRAYRRNREAVAYSAEDRKKAKEDEVK